MLLFQRLLLMVLLSDHIYDLIEYTMFDVTCQIEMYGKPSDGNGFRNIDPNCSILRHHQYIDLPLLPYIHYQYFYETVQRYSLIFTRFVWRVIE